VPLYAEPRILPAGDLAVSVELADEISREANARVLIDASGEVAGVVVVSLLIRCDSSARASAGA